MLKVFRLCYSYINSLNFTWKSAVRLDKKLGTVFLLRLALVSIRRKALLSSVGFRKRMTSRSPRSSTCDSSALLLAWFLVRDFVPLFRSFLDRFQSIQTRRCHWLRLKDVLMFQASSHSAGKRTFRWMLLNNIPWMAPDLGDNYTLLLSLLNTCTV